MLMASVGRGRLSEYLDGRKSSNNLPFKQAFGSPSGWIAVPLAGQQHRGLAVELTKRAAMLIRFPSPHFFQRIFNLFFCPKSDRLLACFLMSDVTQLLNAINAGDPRAADQLLPLVYEELRKLAAVRMAQEQANQTLQPTALVHEAWLRLTGGEQPAFDGRGHFFAAAAEAMRRILIEKARSKGRRKRGGEWERVGLENLDVAVATDDDTLLAVHEALEKLAVIDPTGAKLIELRFFAGLSNVDAARALGLAERTAKRTWAYARAWLHEELTRKS
jgi:RNA polymerase sigma factor (TIGR02999 family)